MTAFRTSPVHDLLPQMTTTWPSLNGMAAILTRPTDETIAAQLGMADCSFLNRFGVKGPQAAAWLADRGIPVPDQPNRWCALPEGGLIARLGMTEFLLEDGVKGAIVPPLLQQSQSRPAQVYPVLRQDLALGLMGAAVPELLRQTCNVNFEAFSLDDRPVVLTSLIGVAVIVIPQRRSNVPLYRIWCDSTFGPYVWRTLVGIAAELGGGVMGAQQIIEINESSQSMIQDPQSSTTHSQPPMTNDQ